MKVQMRFYFSVPGGSAVWTIIHKRKTNKNGGCFRSIAAGIDIRYWRMDIRKACIGSYIRTGGCASDVSYYAVNRREYMVLFHGITIYAEEMTSGRNIRWKFLRVSIMS